MTQYFAMVFVLCAGMVGQDAPKQVNLSVDAENVLLKAEHKHDQVVSQQKQVEAQFAQLQIQLGNYQQQYAKLTEQEKETAKDVDAALDAAWKSAGLSKDKYTFDPASFVFTPKAPEKKSEDAKK